MELQTRDFPKAERLAALDPSLGTLSALREALHVVSDDLPSVDGLRASMISFFTPTWRLTCNFKLTEIALQSHDIYDLAITSTIWKLVAFKVSLIGWDAPSIVSIGTHDTDTPEDDSSEGGGNSDRNEHNNDDSDSEISFPNDLDSNNLVHDDSNPNDPPAAVDEWRALVDQEGAFVAPPPWDPEGKICWLTLKK